MNPARKRLSAASLFLVAAALVWVVFPPAPPQPAEPAVTGVMFEEAKYIVKEYQGLVAVFVPDSPDVPQKLLDARVSALPKADRNMLEEGILVYSDEELSRLLEDYGE